MTRVEQILGQAAGRSVRLSPDLVMVNDGAGHGLVEALEEDGAAIDRPERLAVVLDHSAPAGSFASAAVHKKLIAFARTHGLRFLQGAGIGYHLLAGELQPGRVAVSSGGHNGIFGAAGALGLHLEVPELAVLLRQGTCVCRVPESVRIGLGGRLGSGVTAIDLVLTLLAGREDLGLAGRVVEFSGEGLRSLSRAERLVLCGTMTGGGALSALIDQQPAATAAGSREVDLAVIRPTIAPPADPTTGRPLAEYAGLEVDAAFVGGCNGGDLATLRLVAAMLAGRRVCRGVRFLIAPATAEAALQALAEGLVDIFLAAGTQVASPGCASCRSDCLGVVGDGEVLISTGSYNFPGCCGTAGSQVFLASAATVARAALAGRISLS